MKQQEQHDELGAFVLGPTVLLAARHNGPLDGRVFAAKDIFDVAETRTGAGSIDYLADAPIASRSAPAVDALIDQGATLVGKAVSDQLAFSMFGTNADYGTPINPAAPDRVPGGSSSGSASAVAGGLVDFALGSDTAGSIRIPASYCGILGIRPTHARISTEGIVPLAPSFDTVGLFARDPLVLRDAFRALIAGAQTDLAVSMPRSLRDITSLVVADDLLGVVNGDVGLVIEEAIEKAARKLGFFATHDVFVGTKGLEEMRNGFRSIQLVEAWQSHGEWISRRRPRLSSGIAGRFAAAAAMDPARADEALPLKQAALDRLGQLLRADRVLALPSALGPASPFGLSSDERDEIRAHTTLMTAPVGLARAPALSLPLAELNGMPIGITLVGLPGEDELLLELACVVLS